MTEFFKAFVITLHSYIL